MGHTDWDTSIAAYHREHPGITETALVHARHPQLGTPYSWLAAAADEPAGQVLDLACGSCPTQPHLQYSSYLGIDRSEAELAAATAAGRGPVRLGDVTSLDLPASSVDTVIMSMALMLVPLPATLAQVARVLRPVSAVRARFPFPLRSADDYTLAVASLYTPGRPSAQLRRAERWLKLIPGVHELPAPLLRIAARKPRR